MNPDRVAADPEHSRDLQTLYISSLDQWPTSTDVGASRFGLFLACDATEVPDDALYAIAGKALASGATYIVTWGPDCERVHDIFDDQHVAMMREAPDRHHITTTWHADESLDEALWFFADVALPGDVTLCAGLAVAVGHEQWYRQIRQRLANLPGLRAAVLDQPE
jgi:hypothetical protein